MTSEKFYLRFLKSYGTIVVQEVEVVYF